jgi:AcrR family transcriptional regulator
VESLEDKKADIFTCAKELFSSKGFKDTNISDITKMAGIGVGTFYNYYPSKEKLFIEIYLKENEQLKKTIMESINPGDDPVQMVQKLLALNLQGMNSNPILKEWYNRELFAKLEKEFYEQGGMESLHQLMDSVVSEFIKKWQAEGKLTNDLDDQLILAIFNSIPYIDLHKNEIGINHFPQILDYLAEFIMKGLMDCKKENDKS